MLHKEIKQEAEIKQYEPRIFQPITQTTTITVTVENDDDCAQACGSCLGACFGKAAKGAK